MQRAVPRGADRLGYVKHAAFRVPTFPKADADPEAASQSFHQRPVFADYWRRRRRIGC